MKRIAISILFIALAATSYGQFESMMGAPKPVVDQKNSQDAKSGKNVTDAKGLKQGAWEKRGVDGTLVYKATFKDDKPVGEMVRYHANGRKKAVVVYDSLGVYGEASLYDEKESLVANGFYSGTLKDSVWSYYDPFKNIICRESFKLGKKDGESAYLFQNGTPYEVINYKNDLKDGDWIQYYRSGKVKSMGLYKAGKNVGAFKVLFEDGSSEIVGFYRDGQPDGIWKFYKTNGKVDYEIHYKYGKILNADELDKRKNERVMQLEKNKNSVKDPEQYRNDPDGYMQGN